MKDFKDLDFHGSNEALRELPEKLASQVPRNWRRAPEKEARVSVPRDPMYVFERSAAQEMAATGLCLAFRSPENLYVCNIVPEGNRDLSFDECNNILDEFVSFAQGTAEAIGIRIETTKGEWRIEDYLSHDALGKLQRYSRAANRTTKTAHPNDQERWFQFVFSSHKEHSALDSSDLLRWLVEAEAWPESQAQAIAIEYEKARALLNFYDERA